MKKILTALFLVCLILPVAALPVLGGKPIDVEGRFGYYLHFSTFGTRVPTSSGPLQTLNGGRAT